MKKRLEIVKKAEEMKIRLGNLNTKKFLKNSEHKIKKKKPVKKQKPQKKPQPKAVSKKKEKKGLLKKLRGRIRF